MKGLPPAWRAAWQARAPRERRVLLALGAFLLLALLAEGLWSAHQARGRLRQQLPQLQQQLATLQQQAADIRTLQSQPAVPTAAAGTLPTTASTLARSAGVELTTAELAAEGPRQLRLRAELPFDRWLEVVGALQRGAQLRLVQGQVTTLAAGDAPGTGGMVRIDALFALPEPN